ncbi:TIGR04222 domain-containing membrane protein [Pseudonocardia sp. TRM90224]|uniref:TIGR04222 domain-containing membrane protein n=1 Tax=Pseudonocardia sp. TRM90224 TaxID=2812678 RepID=UPI001E5957AE|nr:TIGR04222 domain-containing membrane protein [Pseudonocardia sp. TRM90224]
MLTLIYLVVAAAAVALAWLLRRRVAAGRAGNRPPQALSPVEVGHLAGGDVLALTCALAALRLQGLVATAGRDVLVAIGPTPAQAPPLQRAVHAAVAAGTDRLPARPTIRAAGVLGRLPGDQRVRAALDAVEDGLCADGYLLTAADRETARRPAFLPLAAIAAGLVLAAFAVLTGSSTDGIFTIMVGLVAAVGWLLVVVPRRTRLGTRTFTEVRARLDHLAPRWEPSWPLYGPVAYAMAIALFGGAVVWRADPGFAADAMLPKSRLDAQGNVIRSGSGSGSGSGSSSGSEGGLSCGGGDSGGGSSCGSSS